MPSPDHTEREVFDAALDIPDAAERAAFVEQACGSDTDRRRRVESLLRAHGAVGRFLQASEGDADNAPLQEGPGTRVGRYKLLERIGEGGFGVVYLAEQEEPVRRHVALKVIKLGMDTRAVVARFEAERQALAMMEHPNIASVFDGGTTESGRPYFVMEVVRGVAITKFCDERRLTMRERIELFAPVCHAVQHAHQKGVIHRDLKPSNILVTMHDDHPVPKVIDFGIAKATEQRLTDKTLFTRWHQFIGTPAYMSPEQMGLSGLDVDTRSDIYSLGVLLFELLAGRTPFDEHALFQAGFDEIRRIIREKDPPWPSSRVASLSREEQSTAAQQRRLEPARLASQLRGDLDRVVMKCLEKDRGRRYETASSLAQDLRRYLDDLPVLARPDTLGYRLVKFGRRHARGLATTAVVALVLVGFAAYHTIRLTTERDHARREAGKAARVLQLLTDLLTASDPYQVQAPPEPTVRSVLDAGATRVREELAAEPGLQSEVLTVIGRVYQRLGEYDAAQPLLDDALAIERRSATREPKQLAQTLYDLGVLRRKKGDLDGAREALEESLTLRRAVFRRSREDIAETEIADTLHALGLEAGDQGDWAHAVSLYREALAIDRRILGDEHRDTLNIMGNLALALRSAEDLAGAEALYRQVLAIDRRALGDDHPDTGATMADLALVLTDRRDFAGAESLLREAIPISRRALGPNHDDVAMMMNNLAYVLREEGKNAESVAVLEEALAIMRATLGNDHPRTAMSLSYLARARMAQGDMAAAEPLLREAIQIRERVWAADDWRLAATKSMLGIVLTNVRKFEEAETTLLGALHVFKPDTEAEQREIAMARERLVALYEAWGQPEKAAPYREPVAPD